MHIFYSIRKKANSLVLNETIIMTTW